VWISFVSGLVVGLLVCRFWYRGHDRLVKAALDVVNDFRDRRRLYPAFYSQPHMLKVMNALDIAIAVDEHRNRVRETEAVNNLIDALKEN
jgi:hypothetical protein